ncbi:tRNA1(Val) (adenine(37)-N6)-methyltransferase [Mucilaginibacter aquaedulcis]|uniref:tRNA1(Val) (adenine(37)-N6)-methyltransferase n=1 Tax=Mucilaginibacter aquaedulcis TaxID=1187081 RepID=UPI0025B44DA0|nr:methyltransferase [Mucilaginibacter aquaedulcis]MDN3547366.1 methyltransferase [Mucilaginibacter aquaedulcis]
MANLFRFKQFSVDQTGCAMKINTDGVLLGALADFNQPQSVLDIGTGTGVITLMLAQRFPMAQIDAVEIDEGAAATAEGNFENSPFYERLTLHASGFEEFFATHPEKSYDVIVSNPPFYINSLLSPGSQKNLAKHAGDGFFKGMMNKVSKHLTPNGACWLILPVDTAMLVKSLALSFGLYVQKIIKIRSFDHDEPHREILVFVLDASLITEETLVIYDGPKVYTQQYQELLRNFLIIF